MSDGYANEALELSRGERYEVELLLEALPVDDAGGLRDACLTGDPDEAVDGYLSYVEKGHKQMWSWLALADPEMEWIKG